MQEMPRLQETAQTASPLTAAEGCAPLIRGVPSCQVSYGGRPGRKGCRNHAEMIVSTVGVHHRLACPYHLHRVMLQMRQHPLYAPGASFTIMFAEE
jgi:hypothetical protein